MRCQVSYDRQTAKMFRKDAVMTVDEAKEFYFKYNGYMFHMDREEPHTYAAFKQLEISSDTLREWDEELLEGLFETLVFSKDDCAEYGLNVMEAKEHISRPD